MSMNETSIQNDDSHIKEELYFIKQFIIGQLKNTDFGNLNMDEFNILIEIAKDFTQFHNLDNFPVLNTIKSIRHTIQNFRVKLKYLKNSKHFKIITKSIKSAIPYQITDKEVPHLIEFVLNDILYNKNGDNLLKFHIIKDFAYLSSSESPIFNNIFCMHVIQDQIIKYKDFINDKLSVAIKFLVLQHSVLIKPDELNQIIVNIYEDIILNLPFDWNYNYLTINDILKSAWLLDIKVSFDKDTIRNETHHIQYPNTKDYRYFIHKFLD